MFICFIEIDLNLLPYILGCFNKSIFLKKNIPTDYFVLCLFYCLKHILLTDPPKCNQFKSLSITGAPLATRSCPLQVQRPAVVKTPPRSTQVPVAPFKIKARTQIFTIKLVWRDLKKHDNNTKNTSSLSAGRETQNAFLCPPS